MMKYLLTTSLLFMLSILHAQEVRGYLGMQYDQTNSDPFIGVGVGYEQPASRITALNVDVHLGFADKGTLLAIEPAILFYLGRNQGGFFIGPSLSYMSFFGSDGVDDDTSYGVGGTFGVKSSMSERMSLLFQANPFFAFGGREVGNEELGFNFQIGVGYKLSIP